ncbi:MAG: FAD:protein FMN transferase [Thermotogae bacterium]|jgi:thiamine biosynthesis lipoprotein|nr:FAD:protein FMN transferase [Thermotogota bacterium]MCL5033373.1 FAD:protein FMN transferase [Thermotogota bacterium]
MRKRNIIILIFTVVIVGSVIASIFLTKVTPKYYTRYGVELGTNVEISYATRKGNAKEIVDKMFNEFEKYDRIFDPWIAGSELYNLNHSDGKWVKVSPDLLYVIKASMNFAQLTDGTFDPTIGRLVPLWGFNTDNTKSWHLPTPQEIQESLKHVGYKNVEINENEVKLLNGVWLDLNGMMEGYIDQMLINMARQNDPESSGFVDVGGTVGIIGPKYGNQPWIIGIQNPRGNPNDSIAYVKLYNGYVGTSGDYERYIIVDGKRYYHIFDPKTGYSNDYFESVTTVSTRSIFSDGFGVFSMVAGQSAMEKMASKLGVAYYAINEQGQVIKNGEWQQYEYKP